MPAQLTNLKIRDVAIKLHRAGRSLTVLFLHGAGGVPQWLPFFEALTGGKPRLFLKRRRNPEGAPSNTQGSGMPRCKQVGVFQRWGAVNHRLRSLFACGEGDFPLPEPARSATLGSKPPGIR